MAPVALKFFAVAPVTVFEHVEFVEVSTEDAGLAGECVTAVHYPVALPVRSVTEFVVTVTVFFCRETV